MTVNSRFPNVQRAIVLCAALAWGASLVFVLLPAELAWGFLTSYGLKLQVAEPLLLYWLRMAGVAFTALAILFVAILLRPQKYALLIPLLAWLHLYIGAVLLLTGWSLALPLLPWLADTAFCFCVGLGLLVTQKASATELETASATEEVTAAASKKE